MLLSGSLAPLFSKKTKNILSSMTQKYSVVAYDYVSSSDDEEEAKETAPDLSQLKNMYSKNEQDYDPNWEATGNIAIDGTPSTSLPMFSSSSHSPMIGDGDFGRKGENSLAQEGRQKLAHTIDDELLMVRGDGIQPSRSFDLLDLDLEPNISGIACKWTEMDDAPLRELKSFTTGPEVRSDRMKTIEWEEPDQNMVQNCVKPPVECFVSDKRESFNEGVPETMSVRSMRSKKPGLDAREEKFQKSGTSKRPSSHSEHDDNLFPYQDKYIAPSLGLDVGTTKERENYVNDKDGHSFSFNEFRHKAVELQKKIDEIKNSERLELNPKLFPKTNDILHKLSSFHDKCLDNVLAYNLDEQKEGDAKVQDWIESCVRCSQSDQESNPSNKDKDSTNSHREFIARVRSGDFDLLEKDGTCKHMEGDHGLAHPRRRLPEHLLEKMSSLGIAEGIRNKSRKQTDSISSRPAKTKRTPKMSKIRSSGSPVKHSSQTRAQVSKTTMTNKSIQPTGVRRAKSHIIESPQTARNKPIVTFKTRIDSGFPEYTPKRKDPKDERFLKPNLFSQFPSNQGRNNNKKCGADENIHESRKNVKTKKRCHKSYTPMERTKLNYHHAQNERTKRELCEKQSTDGSSGTLTKLLSKVSYADCNDFPDDISNSNPFHAGGKMTSFNVRLTKSSEALGLRNKAKLLSLWSLVQSDNPVKMPSSKKKRRKKRKNRASAKPKYKSQPSLSMWEEDGLAEHEQPCARVASSDTWDFEAGSATALHVDHPEQEEESHDDHDVVPEAVHQKGRKKGVTKKSNKPSQSLKKTPRSNVTSKV